MKIRVCILVLFAILFSGCSFSLSNSEKSDEQLTSQSEKVTVSIDLNNEQDRTALPDIDWDSFEYELTAIKNPGEASVKDLGALFSNRTRSTLGSVELDVAKYRFTLNAYSGGTKVLSGIEDADLSSGAVSLSFKMYAVSGAKGAARVSITFPKDGTVSSVKAVYSTDIFAEDAGEMLDIKTVSGQSKVTFEKGNLPSNTEQYVMFYFYDAAGQLVYSGVESLIIVGGCTSAKDDLVLTSADWRSYACSVQINKDGAGWASSGKHIKLVNEVDPLKFYELKDSSGGLYTASVADGTYYIYINDENTNFSFKSAYKNYTVNYYTVQLENPRGCQLNVVSGGSDAAANSVAVLLGKSVTCQISILDGYKIGGSGYSIKQNSVQIPDAAFDTDMILSGISSPQVLTVTGLEPIPYTISYVDSNGAAIQTSPSETAAYWMGGYSAPLTFDVEHPAELPTLLNVKKNGKIFDAWKDGENVVKTTEGVFKNLSLKANWKDFVTVKASTKEIFANGISLLIKANGAKTEIYADFDGQGDIDVGVDEQIVDAANGSNTDFTDYTLRAGNEEGKPVNSDFTFTMTGGRIAAIYGLDSKDDKHLNKSTLNISGTAVIGSSSTPVSKTDPETGVTVTKAQTVTGVMLETITNEWVNIVGKMEGNYAIYCVTPYAYDKANEHRVAYIGNSAWADMKHFTCYRVDEDFDGYDVTPSYETFAYTKNILAMKKITENSVTRTVIRLADNSGVDLPSVHEIEGDVKLEFSLGGSRVTTDCSVFSIYVEKGTFRVNDRLTITHNETDEERLVESTLTYMAQPVTRRTEGADAEKPYVTTFAFDEPYVYMQVLSAGNQLTPEMASDFLSQVYFKRDNPEVSLKVKINLETVPSEEIAANDVKYFNGSFYKLVDMAKDHGSTKTWIQSYDLAKTYTFNGLKGYLMNISSDVENFYIFNSFPKSMSWCGGCRLANTNGIDSDTFSYSSATGYDYWIWEAGPEAGQKFWSKKSGSYTESSIDSFRVYYKADGTEGDSSNGTLVYANWNNKYLKNGSTGAEPNNSSTEQACQFLTSDVSEGHWNDLSATSVGSGQYMARCFFVEFTPYTVYWNGTDAGANAQIANYQAIVRDAVY